MSLREAVQSLEDYLIDLAADTPSNEEAYDRFQAQQNRWRNQELRIRSLRAYDAYRINRELDEAFDFTGPDGDTNR